MVVQSTRFGVLEVDEKNVLRFPEGLPGFPEEKSFAFLPYGPDSPFAFLQSITEPNLTFLIVEPFTFFVEYQFEIDDELAESLGLTKKVPPQVFNIVTVPEQVEDMTVNLLAPIVVNWEKRLAVQVILGNISYNTSHRLFPNGFPKQTAKRGRSSNACSKP